MARLSWMGLGWSFGIVWGLGMLVCGWGALLFSGWGGEVVEVMGSVYVGFEPTWIGGLIGLVWGFIDGFICGAIIAWLYNMCSKVGGAGA